MSSQSAFKPQSSPKHRDFAGSNSHKSLRYQYLTASYPMGHKATSVHSSWVLSDYHRPIQTQTPRPPWLSVTIGNPQRQETMVLQALTSHRPSHSLTTPKEITDPLPQINPKDWPKSRISKTLNYLPRMFQSLTYAPRLSQSLTFLQGCSNPPRPF